MTNIWRTTEGVPSRVTFVARGFRDVTWCPYLNEPAILEWHGDQPYCPNCQAFDADSHPFICHIEKRGAGNSR